MSRLIRRRGPRAPSRRAAPQPRRRSPGPRQRAAEAGKTQARVLGQAPRRNRKFLSAVGMIRLMIRLHVYIMRCSGLCPRNAEEI